MPYAANEPFFMARALELARQGLYTTCPNPRVGCVLVQNDQVVGEGFHHHQGADHAEVMALKQAQEKAQGAVAYVTLEPCSHFGKTPPCADALIRAGVKKVFIAVPDPNPQVAGNGIKRLKAAGIDVDCGLMAAEARALNLGFFSRFERQRPYIRVKIALSMDGKIALNNGISQWITGEAARLDVQKMRAQSSAILTGIGTVLADNPRLTVRALATSRPPVRIVMDSHFKIPKTATLLKDDSAPVWIFTTQTPPEIDAKHLQIFQVRDDKNGQVSWQEALTLMANQGINELWVEAGANISGSLMAAGFIDELWLYQAPIFLGHDAQNAFRLPEITQLSLAYRYEIISQTIIGKDCRTILQPLK